jgi:cell division protein FtsA
MLVGIDIGSHKICTLIGEALGVGGLRILGIGHAPAAGIRTGEVVHVEEAAGAIAASLERAERVAGTTVDGALVGLTGLHLESQNNRAVLPCGRRPRPIDAADVDRVLESAGTVPLSDAREVLHVLPRRFQLDDGGPIVSPVGMEGFQLAAEVHMVTAGVGPLAAIRRCLQLAEAGPTDLVFATLAAAEATLTADERQLGVFVVDLGAATTGLACYQDGAVAHSAVLPLGGRHMTHDLAVVLQTPLAHAERIKLAHGHVLPELDDDGTEVEVLPFGHGERRTTSRRHVSEILAARADELGQLVTAELGRVGLAERLPAGAVLVGGGSELGGLARRLCDRWGVPVRVGRPTELVGLAEGARGPAHAAAVGLLHWSARGVKDAASLGAGRERALAGGGVGRMMDWARVAFLPNANGRRP